jgi:3',5'-cyclic AMP phosphodiesterase CpdA
MLIGQLTDIHLGFDPENPAERNRKRLDRTIAHLSRPGHQPNMLLATGDLTESGDIDSYRRLRDAFGQCPFPVWPCLGNHDLRANFNVCFPEIPLADGFVQYEVPGTGSLRVLVIDTLEEGHHGGAFCDTRAAWLSAKLAEAPEVVTAIAMHHPPLQVGIDWMDMAADDPWVARFAATIAPHGQVRALICGHLHRPVSASWNGVTVSVCSSSAPQLALDLTKIDPELPDDRAMILEEPPAYALHRWDGRHLVSHFDTVDDYPPLASYDAGMQDVVRHLMAEKTA